MKRVLMIALLALPMIAMAKTGHAIKPGHGLKAVGHATAAVSKFTARSIFDVVEAGVDSVGVGLQAAADVIDMGIAVPLEKIPVIHYVGVAVHELYLGIDYIGMELAQ